MEASDDSAAAKVLAVPELMENILLNLPLSRLFTLQRVNSTFKGVIAGSIAIRRRMFLEPLQLNDFDEANQLLSDKLLRQATYPFVLRFEDDGAPYIEGPFVDAELSCSWMYSNKNANGKDLFYNHTKSESNATWRAIRVPQDSEGFVVAISCEDTYWRVRDLPRCYYYTLGSVMDQARQTTCGLWSGSWKIKCEKNHHLGPTRETDA